MRIPNQEPAAAASDEKIGRIVQPWRLGFAAFALAIAGSAAWAESQADMGGVEAKQPPANTDPQASGKAGVLKAAKDVQNAFGSVAKAAGALKAMSGQNVRIQFAPGDAKSSVAAGLDLMEIGFAEEARRGELRTSPSAGDGVTTVELSSTFYVWTNKFDSKRVAAEAIVADAATSVRKGDDAPNAGVNTAQVVLGAIGGAVRLLAPWQMAAAISDGVRRNRSHGPLAEIYEAGRQDIVTKMTITPPGGRPQTMFASTFYPGDAEPYKVADLLRENQSLIVRFLRDAQRGVDVQVADGIVPQASPYAPRSINGAPASPRAATSEGT